MYLMEYEGILKSNISKIIKEMYNLEDVNIAIENPKEIANGIFSSNIALVLTKVLKRNPLDIASEVQQALMNNAMEEIKTIEVAKPGFINFHMKEQFFLKVLESNSDTNYQFPVVDNDKYLVEYVSANPTGDLHLGHARNAVYGSSLVNVMKKYGLNVESEYYLNDAGNQMNNLGLSVKFFYHEKLGLKEEFPEDGYRGNDIQRIANDLFEEYKDSKKDAEIEFFIEYGYQKNLQGIKDLLASMRIEFDHWTSEKWLYSSQKVADSLKVLKAHEVIYTKDDAVWLKTSEYGDEKDRVVQKQDGSFTYFTADIAYHVDKFNRGYTRLIDVWGADHHGYIPRVKAAIKSLGYDDEQFEVDIIQMVSILSDNVAVKMSKRAGTSVTIKELLETLDVESLIYFFVMRANDRHLDFDIQLAEKKDSENPIYYIQYASARINSVLQLYAENNYDETLKSLEYSEIEKQIVLQLGKYVKVIQEAATKRTPHIICNYLYDLANLFHRYYNQEKVFTDDVANVNKKIEIYKTVQIIIKDALALINIEAKTRM